MKPFKFCPACGAELAAPDSEEGAHCERCGRSWYRNPAPTVGGVIVREGRALVTLRARAPMKGRYDVPGGFLRWDEDVLTGLRREVREELGVTIDVTEGDFLQSAPHRYGSEGDWVLSLGFKARLLSGDPTPADDVAGFDWVSAEELDDIDWAWEHDRDLVRKALEDGGH